MASRFWLAGDVPRRGNKHRSKNQLEGKLDLTHRRARTADGAEAIGSIGAVRIPPSEEVVIGVAPVRVVRRIKRFPSGTGASSTR